MATSAQADADLSRFIAAQAGVFESVLAELRAGAKQGHWMWFVFPQLAGLGRSDMAIRFALAGVDAARAYAAHPVLGARYRACCLALAPWAGQRPAEAIMGAIDALKLRSSLTLFERTPPVAEPCARLLDGFFAGQRDPLTLARIG